MVATARALMAKPKILLMDEPSMGLAPVLFELIKGSCRTWPTRAVA
jgi:branched-chain amino acid transport system ATP-binding protein